MVIQNTKSTGEDCQLRQVAKDIRNEKTLKGRRLAGGLVLEYAAFTSKDGLIVLRVIWETECMDPM